MIALVWVLAATLPSTPQFSATAVFARGDATAGRLELDLTNELKKLGVELADLNAAFSPEPEPSAEGDKLFTDGREAYDNLDFDAAAKKLSAAASFFLKHPSASKDSQLAEIFLFLGASELQNRAKADAQKDFARAILMNPKLKPDSKYFGADVQTAFAKAKKDLDRLPSGKLSVGSEPSGAQVELQGEPLGLTPLAAQTLKVGRYSLRLKRDGFAPTAAFAEIAEGKLNATKLTLGGAFAAVRGRALSLINLKAFGAAQQPAQTKELAQSLRSRFLVLALIEERTVTYQVWDTATGNRLKDLSAPVAGPLSVAGEIAQWIRRPAPLGDAVAEAQPSGASPVYKKWWFWAACGAAAVAVGTTVAVAAQPRNNGFNVVLANP